MARKRIGELLLETGAISPTQLEAGLSAQRSTRQRLGMTLIQQKVISEEQLASVLSEALGFAQVQLDQVQVEWGAVHVLRARFCEQHELFPWALSGEGGRARKQLLIAMADPLNVAVIEEIEFTTGLKVVPHIATHSAVRSAILRYYHKVPTGEATGPVQVIQRGGVIVELERAPASGAAGGQNATPVPLPSPVETQAETEEELVLVGELIAEGEEAPVASDDERTAFAEFIRAREVARREQRKGRSAGPLHAAVASDLDYLFGGAVEVDPLEELERKFWAVMRIMARKGLISREEFMREVEGDEPKEG